MDRRSRQNAPAVSDRKSEGSRSNDAPPDRQEAFPVPAPLENEIEQALEGVIGPEKAGQASAVIVGLLERHEFFEGPLPPPALLRQYEDIVPGAAERILAMAERQHDHQIFWERTAVTAQSRNSFWGLNYGFVIGLSLIAGALFCAFIGQVAVALLLVGASALGLIPTFINAWKRAHDSAPKPEAPQNRDGKKKK